MDDLVWASKDSKTKILVPPNQHGLMVKQIVKDGARERWVTWDAFFSDSDKIDSLEKDCERLRIRVMDSDDENQETLMKSAKKSEKLVSSEKEIEQLKEDKKVLLQAVQECFYHSVMRDPQVNTHKQACDSIHEISKGVMKKFLNYEWLSYGDKVEKDVSK